LGTPHCYTSGDKAAGAWRWPPTTSSAEVKERVELYLYFSSGRLWPILGWTLFQVKTIQPDLLTAQRVLHEGLKIKVSWLL